MQILLVYPSTNTIEKEHTLEKASKICSLFLNVVSFENRQPNIGLSYKM